MAQKLRIRFLPNTWQPARPPIGEGATSNIHQSSLNAQTGFAFKTVGDRDKRDRSEKDIFERLINEMVILCHAQIRNHPNILELQGIGWDISNHADQKDPTASRSLGKGFKVWPVLVFEKSGYGDLFSFACSKEGRELGFHERLALCSHVGRAVAQMQSNRIVHGDLKPQNILIFKNKNGSWLAKVADFGFSKWHNNEQDGLELPRSWPWYAPEYLEYPDFTPQQAMRMDVFSFGMLCLWLIFDKNLSGVIPLANELPDILRSAYSTGCPLKFLAECKHRRLLTELSHRLVMQEAALDIPTQQQLQRLFSSSLSHDPYKRDVDMVHLMNNIGMAENSVSPDIETNEIFDVTDDEFNLSYSLHSLYRADFRLRSYILKCLEDVVIAKPDSQLRRELLQCYEIKFGCSNIANQLPIQSQDLNPRGARVRLSVAMSRSFLIKGQTGDLYSYLNDMGHVSENTIVDSYYAQNILAEAEFTTQQEIEGLEMALGRNHLLTTLLKSILSSIRQHQLRWQEAEELTLEIINTRRQYLGPQDPYVLDEVVHLVEIYRRQGRWKEAEDFCDVVTKLTIRRHGNEHPNAITSIVNLSSIIASRGRLHDAEELVTKAVAVARKILGDEHPVSLFAIETLAHIYGEQGRWTDAQELQILAVKGAQAVFGPDSHDTLRSQWTLVSIYEKNALWLQAESLNKDIDTILFRLIDRGFITSSTVNGVPFDIDDTHESVSQQQAGPAAENVYHQLRPEHILSDIDVRDDNGLTALARAAKEGGVEGVDRLLAQGADIEARDKHFMTPFLHASLAGHTVITEKLLEQGADTDAVNNMGHGPLQKAVLGKHSAILDMLLPRTTDINRSDHNNKTALHHAAEHGYCYGVSVLMAGGADPEAKADFGYTPLMWAIEWGHEKTAKLLLDLGADIEARDEKDLTPLLRAVEVGKAPIVRLLLERGANIHASDNCGWTALMWAAQEDDEVLVRLLLQKGAYIDAAHAGGYTPLLAAADYGSETVVRILLCAGADIAAATKSGRTALSIAVARGHEGVAKLLREWREGEGEGKEAR